MSLTALQFGLAVIVFLVSGAAFFWLKLSLKKAKVDIYRLQAKLEISKQFNDGLQTAIKKVNNENILLKKQLNTRPNYNAGVDDIVNQLQ